MNDLELAKIARLVFFVRGEKVMLDADLARLYGATTGNLNKAVKRNQRRFPGDFIFQLTEKETENLIFQSGRSKGRGGRRHRPYAFTEQGVAMLSSVLNVQLRRLWTATPISHARSRVWRRNTTKNSLPSLPRSNN